MTKKPTLTAADIILLAASDLASAGQEQFTEWDLTVAAWKRDPARFGCRGYELLYPDHKRVMTEIMGKTKKDNPIRRGWVDKVGPNRYHLTHLGLAEADRKAQRVSPGETTRSPQPVYEAIEKFAFHRAFQDHCRDTDEPQTWLAASAFLGLTKNTGAALDDRLRALHEAIASALHWMEDHKQNALRSGPVGGRRTIRLEDVLRLREFVGVLENRFADQMTAVRKRK